MPWPLESGEPGFEPLEPLGTAAFRSPGESADVMYPTVPTSQLTGGGDGGGDAGFRHEALFYTGVADFAERAARFVRDALDADEPTLVAVTRSREAALRAVLGRDAGLIEFLDMESVGRNPARILPAWSEWVARHRASGRRFRGVGEPIWARRAPAEVAECQAHEVMLNAAFADGPGWWLVCPYDLAGLTAELIAAAHRDHPAFFDGSFSRESAQYVAVDHPLEPLLRRLLPVPAAAPLVIFRFAADDLPRLRDVVAETARSAGVPAGRVQDFVLSAHELASNSVMHGGGSGILRMWVQDGSLVCDVSDRGLITDPFVGRRRPEPGGWGGAGLWIVNQACDLVRIQSIPGVGTTVRMQMTLGGRSGLTDPEAGAGSAS